MLTHSCLCRPPLVLLFVLFALPTLSLAQKPTTPISAPSKDTILFDFEMGNYEGWTLTGDCWDKQPATAKTFVDRQGKPLVTGIVGNGYLTTLFRNAAAIGKAVSREFTVDKPFLTFRIGGGNYPKQACLNLVVDGKIVRTETGSDSAELRPGSWDVSPFVGKSAHLEVLDTTANPNRGYIMVDDIHISFAPSDKRLLDIESGPTLAQFGIQPYFLSRSKVRFTQIYGNRDCAPLFDFGVTPQIFKQLVDTICVQTYRKRHEPLRSIQQTAQILCTDVDQAIAKQRIEQPKKLLVDWLRAEAVCAYVFSNVKFDADGLNKREEETRDLQERPFHIFAMKNPVALCPAFSKIAAELAYESKLKCCTINGVCRWKSGVVTNDDGHSWVMFDFGEGIRVPADVRDSQGLNCSTSAGD